MSERLTSPFSRWSVAPGLFEPAHGYYLRLVADEGHNSARVYSAWIDVNGRNFVPERMLEVVSALPISEGRKAGLHHATPLERDGGYLLGGQRFAKRDLAFSTRRWCPACLAEKAYHRAWWDVAAVRRCPYHDLEIVDRDVDGLGVGWYWPRFDVTKDGLDLAGAKVPKVLRRGTFAAYLLGRFGLEERGKAPLLDKLSMSDVIDLCQLVGRLLSNPRSKKMPKLCGRTIDVGYRALRGSRSDLVAAIGKWLSRHVDAETLNHSFSVVFGWAYGSARASGDTASAKMLIGVFRAAHFAALTGDTADHGELREGEDISLTELATELGIDRYGLANLVDALAKSPVNRNGRRRLKLDAGQASFLRAHVRGLMTRVETGALLGLPGWAVQQLVDAGHLTPVAGIGDGLRGSRFLRVHIDRVLEKIASLPLNEVRRVQTFLTYWRSRKIHAGDLAVAILEGDVAVHARDPSRHGFDSLRVGERR